MNHDYFHWDIDQTQALLGSYDVSIVIISYVVAVLAGFCALSILNFIKISHKNHRQLKLLGGVTLGLGIWSMHFTGMLAFSLPIPVFYSLKITLFSVIPAIVASIVVLHKLSKPRLTRTEIAVAGFILAIGISAMHFVGMAAMSMQAFMAHEPILYFSAIIVSWGLAVLTILIKVGRVAAFNLSTNNRLILEACFFGFSMATMHYLAMSSTYFFPDVTINAHGINDKVLTYGMVISTVVLMTALTIVLFYKGKVNVLIDLASANHKRMEETIDHMQDGFVLTDEAGSVLLLNTSFNNIFGQLDPKFSGVGDNIHTMYSRLSKSYFKSQKNQNIDCVNALMKGKAGTVEAVKIQAEDGKWWLLRQNHTHTNALIQTWTDITSQVAQEQELIVAKETAFETLEHLKSTQNELIEAKKIASLGGVVTGVAHELNTPLGIGITALSSIKEVIEEVQSLVESGSLKKSHLEDALVTVNEFEALAMKNLERVAGLIQQFRHISADQEIENPKQFSLLLAIEEMLPVWRRAIDEKMIKIHLTLDKNLSIFSYENAFLQVISCLVNNSIEHGFKNSEQGSISMSADIIDERLIFEYSDNGCGIDKDIVETIFEPFVTTNRSEGGIGLGLHIAYNLVFQKLRGKIKLTEDGTNGQATTFIIDIPVCIGK